jgi:hypothetical protein
VQAGPANPRDHPVKRARHRRLEGGFDPVDLGQLGEGGALNLLVEEVPVGAEMIESTTGAPSSRRPMSQVRAEGWSWPCRCLPRARRPFN